MITERQQIEIRGSPVSVIRKPIKNLHIGVYPPDGRVRVAAPSRLTDDAVRLAVISRLGWIRRQQARFAEQARQSAREMVTGESQYFQGRRYRLNVIEHAGPPRVSVPDKTTLELRVRPNTDPVMRRAILQQWYRTRLREQIPPLVEKWEPKAGVNISEVRIRRMKTRWGSCNPAARRLWLSLELAKKPASCLEYVFVHELVHLFERRHNERFQKRMDTLFPTWRIAREELNRAPLAHEEWRY